MSGLRDNALGKAVAELKLTAEQIRESQERMEADLRELRLSLFDPDTGLYARVGRNTEFRTSASRWLWVLTTGVTLSMLHALFKYFIKL